MAKFKSAGGKLFIDGHEVLRGWESYSGWYWFATQKIENRFVGRGGGGSMINGREMNDTIWYGFVQGLEEEWGNFSQAEIESIRPGTWEIPKKNLPWSGRRG